MTRPSKKPRARQTDEPIAIKSSWPYWGLVAHQTAATKQWLHAAIELAEKHERESAITIRVTPKKRRETRNEDHELAYEASVSVEHWSKNRVT